MAKKELSYEAYLESLQPKKEDLSYESYVASQAQEEQPAPAPVNEPTLEEKYLEPYVYPVLDSTMKTAAAIAKPASMIATPILETARYGVRALTGQDKSDVDLYSDFKELQNPNASAGKLMEDVYSGLGIEQDKLGAILPKSMQEQFPRAYNLLSQLRPSDVAAAPIDLALYGKLAAPIGAEIAGSTARFSADVFNKQKLAKNIIKAGSTDAALFNDLSRTGKINSVAKRVIQDKNLNRVDRTKVLDEINGVVIEKPNQYGISRYERAGGQLDELNKKQSQFIESLEKDNPAYTYNAMEANIRAKEMLNNQGVLTAQKEKASKIVDDMMPFANADEAQLGIIEKRQKISKQLDEVNVAVEAQKMEELSKLSKANMEAFSTKDKIPFFVDNPNYQPPRTEYVTVKEAGPVPEYTPIKPQKTAIADSGPTVGFEPDGPVVRPEPPIIEKTVKQPIPAQGDELVWNREGAQKRLDLVKRINDIQGQIEAIKGSGYRNHPALKAISEKRDALVNEFWSIAETGFPDQQAYMDHLTGLNTQPIQVADDIRKHANKYKSSLVKGAEDYTAGELAASAVEQSARQSIDHSISNMPADQASAYYANQSKISDLMSLNDLYAGTYAQSNKNINVPIGDMIRGTAREALSLKGNYIDPILLDMSNKYDLGEGTWANTMRTVGAMSAENMVPKSSLISKGVPSQLQAMTMQRGLIENLADYEIPRSSSDILKNPQLALAKLAQVTDNQGLINGLKDALEKHPDKLKTLLPLLGTQFPNLFTTDKYNRFDGKIFHPDPMMRQQLIQQAYKDVELKAKNNTEKIILQDGLNRDGSLPYSFQ